LHRFIIVHVFDKKGRFFLQKRSYNRSYGCMFAESVCAHVRYGENYLVTAKRKIREEFVGGIDRSIELKEITKDRIYTKNKNWINKAFLKIYGYLTNEDPNYLKFK
jgi:isopentenyldiphosphate isomerase